MSGVKLTKKAVIISSTLIELISVGISSYYVFKFIDSQADVNIQFMGQTMKLSVFNGLLGVASSLLSDSVTDTVMNKLNRRIQNLSKEVVSVGTHAGFNVGIMAILDEKHGLRGQAAMIGAVSTVIAD